MDKYHLMEELVPKVNANPILREDLKFIFNSLTDREIEKLSHSTILITGCGGFLGYAFMQFFYHFAEELNLKKVIALDNFLTGSKFWLEEMAADKPNVIQLQNFDIIQDSIDAITSVGEADFIIHLASIASPSFYRMYPIETVDANVTGLRRLLEFYTNKKIKGFLFFSSSEVYGDPFPEFIPTKEDYRGNVATIGPRACYDEAKRFGETLCYLFAQKHNMPITIVRPFNNFGPGMNIHDKRLPADFAKAVLEGRDIIIYSDGTPTRTFCYIADAIKGYLKVLLHEKFDVFNIGTSEPEISVLEFAEIFKQQGQDVFDYKGNISFERPPDKEYLTDNPNRRCPDIEKARQVLGYNPSVSVGEGIKRYLEFLSYNKGKL